MFCAVECAGTVPQAAGGGCAIVSRSGGIRRGIFASCDVDFTDITDLTEWEAFIDADKIHATGEILGQKPKGSPVKKKFSSKKPEQTTGVTRTVTFMDYNSDNTGFTDYDFYNTLDIDSDKYVFGYISDDELFYGFIPQFSIDVDDVREEDVNGNTMFDVSVSWNQRLMQKPVKITGLLAILK